MTHTNVQTDPKPCCQLYHTQKTSDFNNSLYASATDTSVTVINTAGDLTDNELVALQLKEKIDNNNIARI